MLVIEVHGVNVGDGVMSLLANACHEGDTTSVGVMR